MQFDEYPSNSDSRTLSSPAAMPSQESSDSSSPSGRRKPSPAEASAATAIVIDPVSRRGGNGARPGWAGALAEHDPEGLNVTRRQIGWRHPSREHTWPRPPSGTS